MSLAQLKPFRQQWVGLGECESFQLCSGPSIRSDSRGVGSHVGDENTPPPLLLLLCGGGGLFTLLTWGLPAARCLERLFGLHLPLHQILGESAWFSYMIWPENNPPLRRGVRCCYMRTTYYGRGIPGLRTEQAQDSSSTCGESGF